MFQITDAFGNTIRLTRWTYESHLAVHPEIADYLAEAEQTLQEPSNVEAGRDGAVHFFKAGLGRGKFQHCHVHVIVRYDVASDAAIKAGETAGVVATYWLDRSASVTNGRKL